MIIERTVIPDIYVITPKVLGDERGFFMEVYEQRKFAEAGINDRFVQDNHAGSPKGILRGLHYQIQQAQAKLVRVVTGEVFDVAVDIRRNSLTFGKWFGMTLSAENKIQMYIPKGFAHGYYVLSDWADVLYKTSDFYAPQWERSLLWSDTTVGIDWPLIDGAAPKLSVRDRSAKTLADAELFND